MKKSEYSETYLIGPSESNVRILEANKARIGCSIYNDTDKTLYLKLGTNASQTSYTVQIQTYGYFELPAMYIGVIEGIWETGVSGRGALVTEFM